MNLNVDVMEGDEFTELTGSVYHYRGGQWRYIAMNHVGEWLGDGRSSDEKPISLTTFTRYCEGCGLTVEMVKPEPKVEEIGPPEWNVKCVMSGKVRLYTTKNGRDACLRSSPNWQPVRINWSKK